jgi:hypothetical protein
MEIRKTDHEAEDAMWLTDGNERFCVPRQYAAAIVKAIPNLRYSFEHLVGKYVGLAPKHGQ